MHRNDSTTQPNSNMTWAGRWPYVAPEVVSTGLSTSADMYALGIILWQLISRVTFPSDALVDPSIYRIEPIPDVLKEWEEIYIDCLHIDPTKRPNAYTVHRRLTHLCNKLRANRVAISETTSNYVEKRRTEINEFLTNYRRSSPQQSDDDDTNSLSSITSSPKNTSLCQVGDLVLTASVTRPSHQRLKSYPSLIQSFPHYP
jgi:hypothetical protein